MAARAVATPDAPAVAAPVPVEKPYGAFTVAQSTDDLTGKVSHYATTTTKAAERPELDLTLFLDCRGKTWKPWYHFGRKLVDGQYGLFVQYRFDDEPAKQGIFPSGGGALPTSVDLPTKDFAKRKGGTVMIRVVDSGDGETVTGTFDLTGIDKAVAALPCGKK